MTELKSQYGFVLEWDDLPPALKCEKVFRYVLKELNDKEGLESCDDINFEEVAEEEVETVVDAFMVVSTEVRGSYEQVDELLKDAEKKIEARFPMYF